jgi:transitional endoplasmic reticulum ATPase
MSEDQIQAFREALKLSPQNPRLRQMLAEALLSSGFGEEAEKEYREALGLWPEDDSFKEGLCRAFYQQGKNDLALALMEEMIKMPALRPAWLVLYARLLLKTGDLAAAKTQYVEAIKQDKSLADEELAKELQVILPSHKGKLKLPPSALKEMVGGVEKGGELRDQTDLERPAVSFKDVGGMAELKEEISMKIIYPLTHPEVFKAYGQSTGGGGGNQRQISFHRHPRGAGHVDGPKRKKSSPDFRAGP